MDYHFLIPNDHLSLHELVRLQEIYILNYCEKRCGLSFLEEKNSQKYYDYKDFENTIGKEVEDMKNEVLRIEMKDLG